MIQRVLKAGFLAGLVVGGRSRVPGQAREPAFRLAPALVRVEGIGRRKVAWVRPHVPIDVTLDELSALWSFYRRTFITPEGQVLSLDAKKVTTSEGQSYALLRAAWQNDRRDFERIWSWTRTHLQTRGTDHLFAWKWKGKVLDRNFGHDFSKILKDNIVTIWQNYFCAVMNGRVDGIEYMGRLCELTTKTLPLGLINGSGGRDSWLFFVQRNDAKELRPLP